LAFGGGPDACFGPTGGGEPLPPCFQVTGFASPPNGFIGNLTVHGRISSVLIGGIGGIGSAATSVEFNAPEPATLGLMALGLLGGAGAGFARRKRRN
jgi:hypothetical protein